MTDFSVSPENETGFGNNTNRQRNNTMSRRRIPIPGPLRPYYNYEYVSIAPERQITAHSQDSWEMNCILYGSGMRTLGDVREPFAAGEVVLVPPGMEHCWMFDAEDTDNSGKISNISLFFNDMLIDALLVAFPDMRDVAAELRNLESAISFTGTLKEELSAVMKEMRYESQAERPASLLRILSLISNSKDGIPIGALRRLDTDEEKMMQIRSFVSCNITGEIRLNEISAHVGMSVSSFCVFFKKQTGQTFISYVNERKLEIACRLLEKGKLSVSEVCTASGFGDPAYFSRIFRSRYGVSPSRWAER